MINIKLHIQGPEKELEKRGRTTIVPILWTEDDTTEDVLQCERDEDRKQRNIEKTLKKNGKKQCRYLDRAKEKDEKEGIKFRKKEAVKITEGEQRVSLTASVNIQVTAHTEIITKKYIGQTDI